MISIRKFTIVELLIAIGLTSVLVNLLATIYVRVSDYAIKQSGALSGYDEIYASNEKVDLDLKRIKLPAYSTSNSTRDFRMIYDNVSLGNNGTVTNTSGHYPYLAFTATLPFSLDNIKAVKAGTYDGYEEVAYLLAPKSTVTSLTAGHYFNSDFLNLYRITKKTGATLMTPTNAVYSSANVVVRDLMWASFKFIQYSNASTSTLDGANAGTAAALALDTLNLSFNGSNSTNKVPDVMEIMLTVSPSSGPFTLIAKGSSTVNGSTDITITSDENADSGLLKIGLVSLSNRGHILNMTRGVAYTYVRSGKNTIKIDHAIPGSGVAAISDGDELYMGISSVKRVELQ